MRHENTLQQFLMFLVHYLESGGVTESVLCEEARLEPGSLHRLSPGALLAAIPDLVAAAARLTEEERIGLRVGEQFHFCLAGAGGFAATHAPTPALALETFGRFVGGGSVLRVTSSTLARTVTLRVELEPDWPEVVRDEVVDGFCAGLVAALRAVCGTSFSPKAVRLVRAEPESPKDHLAVLRCTPSFRHEADEIEIDVAELIKRSRLYEPLLYEQLRFMADLAADQPSGQSPMRQLVEQAVRAGDYTVEKVGATLEMTTRTLQRRLQREGTNFRSVLNAVRVDLAREMLLGSELSVAEIAERLRYSDDKAFRKAVKAFTGKTPTQIRGGA